MLHQGLAYGVIIMILLGIALIIYIMVDTAIDKQVLEKKNDDLNVRIGELEHELERIKNSD